MHREAYRDMRRPYVPAIGNRKAIFIFESPPMNGDYFYNPIKSRNADQLFHAMMWSTLGLRQQEKHFGLCQFRDAGYLLLDATYTPVNDESAKKSVRIARAKLQIAKDFDALSDELAAYAEPETKIIIVMRHVCEVLLPKLLNKEFKIMNTYGNPIPYPLWGRNQARFTEIVRPMLGLAAL